MRLSYPRSFLSLLVLGFTIVVAPLLFALFSNAVAFERLAAISEETVYSAVKVAQSSAEILPNEDRPEIIWANYYANAGRLNVSSQLVNDRASGWVADYSARFRPPREPVEATIWVTVNDQRGGAAWVSFDVLVRN